MKDLDFYKKWAINYLREIESQELNDTKNIEKSALPIGTTTSINGEVASGKWVRVLSVNTDGKENDDRNGNKRDK